jgi:ABC-type antimicrobial peptide transport system permease subunit
MILRGAGVQVLLGATLGVLAAAWTARFLAPLLFRVPELDPASFALGTGVVVAIGLLAGRLPSRRATRVDPAGVLSGD